MFYFFHKRSFTYDSTFHDNSLSNLCYCIHRDFTKQILLLSLYSLKGYFKFFMSNYFTSYCCCSNSYNDVRQEVQGIILLLEPCIFILLLEPCIKLDLLFVILAICYLIN